MASLVVVLSILFFLSSLTKSPLAWDISSDGVTSLAHCAKIFTHEGFKGLSFSLKDKEQVPYMSDMQNWDETTKISVKVKPSCTVNIATRPFLRGTLHEINEDSNSFRLERDESFQNSSILCSCQKRCSCNDVIFRGRECARAYFNKDCTDCNAYYTSLKHGDDGKRVKFPSRFASSVKSFWIRPTCTLRVNYQPEKSGPLESIDMSTEAQKPQVAPFSGWISTTSCECNTNSPEYLNVKTRKPKASDPRKLSISSLRGEINAELKKPGQENHPGLLAALQSLRAKRSPKNAYILLLGLTGSGKSTAVNLLFDHPNITQVGAAQSTTTDIHEFRIPVNLDELGINNSELRIIDTPGIADTRGIAQDARFLATLEEFISKHEELKRHTPNLVLICFKFHDNRFDGEGSAFVKMLKTIELFRSKLIDPKFSNIIFVLTHFMSETKEIQRNPGPKIQRIKRVIEEYSSLPKPVVLVVAENKPEVSELPSLNGYWTLPNGDHYPKNLFDQMQRTLRSCGDPIGLGVIQSAFSHSDEFKIEGKTTQIFNSSDKNVIKYLSALSVLERPPNSTEVGEALDSAYGDLSREIKFEYPSSLLHLKKVFAAKGLNLIKDVPKISAKIVAFLKDVQLNPATSFLLERAFNLTAPVFSGAFVVGSGYDLINDKPLGVPIFNLSSGFYRSDIGYQLPANIKVSLTSLVNNDFEILPTRSKYVEMRLQNLGLEQDSRGLENLLSSELGTKAGLNIVTGPDQPDLKLSSLLEYQTFNIMLNKDSTLSADYLRDLRALGSFDPSNFESVRAWIRFFQLYGTHAVVGGIGGGSISVEVKMNDFYETQLPTEVQNSGHSEAEQNDEGSANSTTDYETANLQLQSQVSSVDRFTRLSQAMGLILQYLANNFLGKETPVTIPEGVTYSIRMRGGDPKFYISNITHHSANEGHAEIWNILDKWQTSVLNQPEILTSYLRLIPMNEILHKTGGLEAEAAAVDDAARAFLNASLIYVPRVLVDNSLEDRDTSESSTVPLGDFQRLHEFAQVFFNIADKSGKSQENFMTTMRGLQKENLRQSELFEERLEEDRLIELERKKEFMEEEAWNRQMQLRREKITKDRRREDALHKATMFETEQELRAHQASQMAAMRMRNDQAFFSLMGDQLIRQRQLAIAQQNRPDWFARAVGFVGVVGAIGVIAG